MVSKEIKRYRKFQKTYQKKLFKLIKEDRCYEWESIVDILLQMLKGRLEYYSNGDNVWQADESKNEIITSLSLAIDKLKYAYEYSNFEFPDVLDYLKNWTDNTEENCHNTYNFDNIPKHSIEEYEEMYNKQNQAYIDAFAYIGEYIRYWWD